MTQWLGTLAIFLGLSSQNPQQAKILAPGDLMPSSELWGQQVHGIHTYRQNIHAHETK